MRGCAAKRRDSSVDLPVPEGPERTRGRGRMAGVGGEEGLGAMREEEEGQEKGWDGVRAIKVMRVLGMGRMEKRQRWKRVMGIRAWFLRGREWPLDGVLGSRSMEWGVAPI